MIGTVLKEMRAGAKELLSEKIGCVAAQHSLQLDSTFTAYGWWQTGKNALQLSFPALSITWDRSALGIRENDQRSGLHDTLISYGVRSADMDYIERHMLYVPEAILLWLDELNRYSRATGGTIIGLPTARGNEIQLSHDLHAANEGTFIWGVDLRVPILALDEALPSRTY